MANIKSAKKRILVSKKREMRNKAVKTELKTVVKAVKKDDKVAFVGFGTYKLVKRAARSGRNPQTGEAMKIKASKSLGFKGSKTAFDKK